MKEIRELCPERHINSCQHNGKNCKREEEEKTWQKPTWMKNLCQKRKEKMQRKRCKIETEKNKNTYIKRTYTYALQTKTTEEQPYTHTHKNYQT